jgi:hypothetical protein
VPWVGSEDDLRKIATPSNDEPQEVADELAELASAVEQATSLARSLGDEAALRAIEIEGLGVRRRIHERRAIRLTRVMMDAGRFRQPAKHLPISKLIWSAGNSKSTLDDLDWRKPFSPSDLVISLSHNRMCVRAPFGGIGGTFRQIAAVKCLPALRKLRYPEVYAIP